MRSAWRGYHLWRQFYAPNQPILWRCCPLRHPRGQIDRPNIAASNFRNVIKRFSRRGQYPTIRCSLRESLTFAPSLSWITRRHTFHGRFETRFATDFVLRFFQRFRSISQALTNPNFSPINWISRPFSEPVERALVIQ